MPQISQLASTYASQVFWMLVFFGFIYFAIGRGMVPKVLATVETRDNQIAADLAAAEAARKSADQAEEVWRVQSNAQRAEAQTLISKAKGEAVKASEKTLAKAEVKTDMLLAEADARIASAYASALKEIETVAAEAAGKIVERLTGAKVDAKAASAAVREAFNA